MAFFIIIATATSAYLGAPWWAALIGTLMLFADSAVATTHVRSEIAKHATGGLIAQSALTYSAVHAGAAASSAFLLGLLSRHLWG